MRSAFLALLLAAACSPKETSGAGGEAADASVGGSAHGGATEDAGNGAQPNSGGSAGHGGTSSDASVDSGGQGLDSGVSFPEHCTNGEDDDHNGATDCEDAECSDHVCSVLPAGWLGPAALIVADTLGQLFCTAPYPAVVFAGSNDLNAPAATCPDCECHTDALACTVNVDLFGNEDCSGSPSQSYQPIEGDVCWRLPTASSLRLSFNVSADGGNTQGSCRSETVGEATVTAYRWDRAAKLCAPPLTGGGCGADGVCAALPPETLTSGLCVYRPGEHTCPEEYPERSVYYASVEDTRRCTECACDTASCDQTVKVSYSRACGTAGEEVSVSGEICEVVTDPTPGNGLSTSFEETVPTCPSVASEPVGAALPRDPTTICCTSNP